VTRRSCPRPSTSSWTRSRWTWSGECEHSASLPAGANRFPPAVGRGLLVNTPSHRVVALGADEIVTVLVTEQASRTQRRSPLWPRRRAHRRYLPRERLQHRPEATSRTEPLDAPARRPYRDVILYEAVRPQRDACFNTGSYLYFDRLILATMYEAGGGGERLGCPRADCRPSGRTGREPGCPRRLTPEGARTAASRRSMSLDTDAPCAIRDLFRREASCPRVKPRRERRAPARGGEHASRMMHWWQSATPASTPCTQAADRWPTPPAGRRRPSTATSAPARSASGGPSLPRLQARARRAAGDRAGAHPDELKTERAQAEVDGRRPSPRSPTPSRRDLRS